MSLGLLLIVDSPHPKLLRGRLLARPSSGRDLGAFPSCPRPRGHGPTENRAQPAWLMFPPLLHQGLPGVGGTQSSHTARTEPRLTRPLPIMFPHCPGPGSCPVTVPATVSWKDCGSALWGEGSRHGPGGRGALGLFLRPQFGLHLLPARRDPGARSLDSQSLSFLISKGGRRMTGFSLQEWWSEFTEEIADRVPATQQALGACQSRWGLK